MKDEWWVVRAESCQARRGGEMETVDGLGGVERVDRLGRVVRVDGVDRVVGGGW